MSEVKQTQEVTDPKSTTAESEAPTEEKSTVEVSAERMAEARESIKGLSDLTPKSDEGSTQDVSTQGSSSKDNTTNIVDLKKVEEESGRKFESVEDFLKHYKNLYGRYGDQEIAKALKAQENLKAFETRFGKSIDEIENSLVTKEEPKTVETAKGTPAPEVKSETPKQKPSETNYEFVDRLAKLEHETSLNALERKYPDSMFLSDVIVAKAKQDGTSYVEAYENSGHLKQLVELKVKEESQKSPVVTPSNRTNVNYKNLEQLGLKMMTGKASESDQIKFAKEYFRSRGKEI